MVGVRLRKSVSPENNNWIPEHRQVRGEMHEEEARRLKGGEDHRIQEESPLSTEVPQVSAGEYHLMDAGRHQTDAGLRPSKGMIRDSGPDLPDLHWNQINSSKVEATDREHPTQLKAPREDPTGPNLPVCERTIHHFNNGRHCGSL